jgi:hypothetical protein
VERTMREFDDMIERLNRMIAKIERHAEATK